LVFCNGNDICQLSKVHFEFLLSSGKTNIIRVDYNYYKIYEFDTYLFQEYYKNIRKSMDITPDAKIFHPLDEEAYFVMQAGKERRK